MAKKTTATKAKKSPAEVCDASTEEFTPCKLMEFTDPDERYYAAELAWEENPVNEPRMERVHDLVDGSGVDERQALALLTSKWWGAKGVRLGVYFDTSSPALKSKLLSHFNAWSGGGRANIVCLEASVGMAQVRVGFDPRDGYWSYLGTDVLKIRSGATMNLAGFTVNTPESTYRRVARHEFGHTLGCPHEHMRKEIIQRLDRAKVLAYFRQTQGWSEQTTVANVLTELEARTLYGVPPLEETSIMTYQLPGSITVDGRPVLGGSDITSIDLDYIATCYPGETVLPPPPPPGGTWTLKLSGDVTISGTGPKPTIL